MTTRSAISAEPAALRHLLVRHGKNKQPFHPAMRIKNTGYCPNQWEVQMFRPGVYPGDFCVSEKRDVAEMVKHYFDELTRTGHAPIKGDTL